MANVAPGIVLEVDSRSIVKGLTSKTDRVLSKTSLTPVFERIGNGTQREVVAAIKRAGGDVLPRLT
jgi:hypothetical protein